MFDGIGLIVLGVFLAFCGAGMIELGITDPDFEMLSRVFSVIFGMVFVLGGAALVFLEKGSALIKKRGKREKGALLKELRSEISPNFLVVTSDKDKNERLIRGFRKDYADFFGNGYRENAPMQSDVTQIYWHALYLQKQRMEQKQIVSRLESERLRYGSIPPMRCHAFFDGKYQIRDVSETIEAKETFRKKNGGTVYVRKSLQTAWYRILKASKRDSGKIVCPNCGNVSTRENLIDGCDFCGTKFTVEDLGPRIAAFCFKPDYETEYARYEEVRESYIKRVALIVGIPVCILSMIAAAASFRNFGAPPVLGIAAFMFAVAFVTFSAILCGELLFFITLFPVLQAKASITYFSKRHLERMKQEERENAAAEKRIRVFDPLFSLGGFFSDINNKLAVIHFANSPAEAAAFADSDQAQEEIASGIARYQDIIDMQMQDMVLTDYEVNGDLQKALVRAELDLLSEKNGKVRKKKETVRLELVKAAACKTQAVCAPSFTVCKKCGAPMSLMDGRVCSHCGDERQLAAYDWAIRSYTCE